MDRGNSRFGSVVEALIQGLNSGAIGIETEEADWEAVQRPLEHWFSHTEELTRCLVESEFKGAVLANEICVRALRLAQDTVKLFRPQADTCVSYWVLHESDPESMVAYYPPDAANRLGDIFFGKIPSGSPCGHVLQTGEPLFVPEMVALRNVLDSRTYTDIRQMVGSLVAWPLRIFLPEVPQPVPVATLLAEARSPGALSNNSATRLLFNVMVFAFEMAFQIGQREESIRTLEPREKQHRGRSGPTVS